MGASTRWEGGAKARGAARAVHTVAMAAAALILMTHMIKATAAFGPRPPGNTTCPCFHCMDSTPCAPPACARCGIAECSGPHGCRANATADCDCSPPTWPSGKGCVYAKTKFAYAPDMPGGGCCQIPAAWMTGPHDSGGTRVAPFPFPYSETSWGSACGFDNGYIPRTARFINGTCKGAGYPTKRGGCLDTADCDCSTTWDRH